MAEERIKGKRNIGDEVKDIEKWVCDSSLDYKGNVPLRVSTGAWKASLFIIAIEFSERLSYFGIATSLIIYLTKVIHQDLETAAKSVNYWSGVTTLMPLIGGFIADAYLGRFFTVFMASIIYILGLALLTMSRVIPSFRPCDDSSTCTNTRRIHVVVFFLSIYLISIGTGGHKPSLESFGADQFDDDHDKERTKKMSFFNWWNFGLCSGLLLGVTLIVYVQDHHGWGAADIVLMIIMTISLVIFVLGRPYYRYRKPSGSFLRPMLQVLVAALAKRNVPYPNSTTELYDAQPEQVKHSGRRLCHTEKLTFLDKAAILVNKEVAAEKISPWSLATVTQVEETKLILNMIPIWLACIPFAVCTSQATTFFIKQATVMNRNIGNNFMVPPASIFGLSALGMIVTVVFYDRILDPTVRRVTNDERGIKILQRIGLGMIFSVASVVTAALVERKRLIIVENEPSSISMSAFWLAPQFVIIGVADGFTLVGLQEYFYDQVPDSMRSLGIGLYLSVVGAANFVSSLFITIISRVTTKAGKSWFGKDLNSSRLDKFYWFLAGTTTVNLFVYVFLARRYKYKSAEKKENVLLVECYDHDNLHLETLV